MLNVLQIIKTRGKLDNTLNTVILWKLPKSLANYVKILLRELFTEIKLNIMECYKAVDIDDTILEVLLMPEKDGNYEKQY
jgi:hypothetical protein